MADDAIDYLNRLNQTDPGKPFFVKYAPGATHAPHHPTKEWVEKIQQDAPVRRRLRQAARAHLREPEEARRDPGGHTAGALAEGGSEALGSADSAEEQKLFIRQVEVFAAYAAYNDHEIGRVIQAVEDMGKLDNTLVIYINGDNGTSAEGGPLGTPNEVAFFNGINMMPAKTQMNWYDVWGTEETYNHMSAGWSWAFDTPFTWFKQNASRARRYPPEHGGVWPERIKDKGGLREQFMHVIDVVPTILEVSGIPAPDEVDGIKQAPIEGTSFAYTFDTGKRRCAVDAQDPVLRDDGPVGVVS